MKGKCLAVMLAALGGVQARAAGNEVLVVLSSESKITLQNGHEHPTGFFLPELMGPAAALLKAGYQLVFANPKGSAPVVDRVSDSAFWYGDLPNASAGERARARAAYAESRALCERLGLCGPVGTLEGVLAPRVLSEVVEEGLDRYAAVFFPGGHAPMEDLWQDPAVGKVLRYFHQAGKPTALICHAPVALLSALNDPQAYVRALEHDQRAAMGEAARHWIYRGYTVAVFTTREEQQEEPGGSDNVLGGYVRFYADAALERAGAFVARADKWQSQVVVSHELITGQNPFSHDAMAEALVQALAKAKGGQP